MWNLTWLRQARARWRVDRQGRANALTLIGAAYAERGQPGACYADVLLLVFQTRPEVVDQWNGMTAEEREELAALGLSLLGPGGARAWIERTSEAVHRITANRS